MFTIRIIVSLLQVLSSIPTTVLAVKGESNVKVKAAYVSFAIIVNALTLLAIWGPR